MAEWLSQPLNVSINKKLVNKNDSKSSYNYVHFCPAIFDATELAESIASGYAYSYIFEGNSRAKKNFIEASIVSVDVDDGMTLDEAMQHELVTKYATIIYTTCSHTDDNNRFRIIFVLENPIDSYETIEALASSLASRLSGDSRTTTSANLFYGNTNANVWTFNNGLPAYVVDELIAEAAEAKTHSNVPLGHEGRSQSAPGILNLDQLIRTAESQELPARDIISTTSIFCPFHEDKNPSAVFNVTSTGRRNVYCFACKKMFTERWNAPSYDFNAFEKAVLRLKAGEELKVPNWVSETAKAALSRADIDLRDNYHLGGIKPGTGLTFVKSPKSSGKTYSLVEMAQNAPSARILVIGHRRSLVRAMCKRLELNCYLDVKAKGAASNQDRFGVCLDSLGTIDLKKPYDYVFIDESEQVLAHFFSETMSDKRPAIVRQLISIVRRASNVLALDADLSWLSYAFMADWFNRHAMRPISIVLNQHKPVARSVEYFQSLNHLVGDLVTNLRDQQRCYVVSNSKAFIDSLSAAVAVNDPEIRFVSITADTAKIKGDAASAFITDPLAQSRRYQLVLSSPVLSSGIDIRFENREKYFDIVYGFFQATTTSHLDCDQQLARVRDPGRIKLYLTPQTQKLETDIEVMKEELRESPIFSYLKNYDDDGIVDFDPDDDLLKLALPVHALQRASKNQLRQNFLEYKRRLGWEFNVVRTSKDLSILGSGYIKDGKGETNDRYTERLMNAPQLNDYEIGLLTSKQKSDEKLTLSETDSLRRIYIERFYRREIFPGLIELDREKRLRDKVRMFERVVDTRFTEADRSVLQAQLASDGEAMLLTSTQKLKVFLLKEALSRTPVFDGAKFNADVWFHRNELREFRDFVLGNNAVFEAQFGRTFGDVVKDNETKVLSDLLRYVFLPLQKDRRTGPNGTRPMYYKLDDIKLHGLTVLSRIRHHNPINHGDEIEVSR
ncbi:plasmid replication protein, CyRepA1 family [Aminobacter sp. UC22_36]|uniref:plasmid replication protein, CyRepA1 family n=1 Tax=Aminobacter sp. UC22_36 TaxID=3374549 RepID=UPI0037566CA0